MSNRWYISSPVEGKSKNLVLEFSVMYVAVIELMLKAKTTRQEEITV